MVMSYNINTEFFYENGTGNIFDGQVQESPGYFEYKSFPLTGLTDLRKYIKNQDIQVEARSSADTEMKEAELSREFYSIISIHSKIVSVGFIFEGKAYETNASSPSSTSSTSSQYQLWHCSQMEKDIQRKTLEKPRLKKIPNKTLNIPTSKLNATHKTHLVNYFC